MSPIQKEKFALINSFCLKLTSLVCASRWSFSCLFFWRWVNLQVYNCIRSQLRVWNLIKN